MKKKLSIFITLCVVSCSVALTSFAAAQVNINAADVKALTTLKGVGEKRAEAIVSYRKQHGAFHSLNDLSGVKGITQKRLAKLQADNPGVISLKSK